MTPALDALIGASGGDASEATVNALSGAMAAAFSLGQCVGPLLGSSAGAHGLDWVTTAVACAVVACRRRRRDGRGAKRGAAAPAVVLDSGTRTNVSTPPPRRAGLLLPSRARRC